MLLAWLAYPVLLLALCAGLGLLLDAACGRRLPGALVAPAGFATLVLLAQAASLAGATVAAVATAAIVLAGVGVALAMPWRFSRPDPWAALAALAVFALFAAPVVLSGHPTFAAYGEEAEIERWLLAGASDPVGAIWPLAVAQRLLGGELAWHLQPYLAVLGALLALGAWQLAAAAALAARPRALVAFVAALPALVFGYAGWGGVQGLAVLAALAPVAALALDWRDGRLDRRSGLPLAVTVAAVLVLLAPFSPLELDTGIWLSIAGLVVLTAAALAVSLGVATARPPLALGLLAAVLAATAIVASAGAALAPYDRLSELREIDARFAGEGPALLFEEQPYAGYFLRDLDPAERRPADPDRVQFEELLRYPLLVTPRVPALSRPALPYKRRYRGPDYEAWQLPSEAGFSLLFHMAIGEPGSPAALPDCSQTVGLGLLALSNQLGAAAQDVVIAAAPPRRGNRLGTVVAVPASEARRLCGRRWDWIEAIGRR
jgi:hypothetical protein